MEGLLGSGKAVSCEKAREHLNEGYTYLDVRTPEEYAAGHVEKSVNVPYKLKVSGGMAKNDKFTQEVSSKFDKDAKLVVACQGGMRSAAAVKELQAMGYSNLVDMGPGFGGWARSGYDVVKPAQ